MRNAVTEMQYHAELIVNDVFEQALMELKSILITHRLTLQKKPSNGKGDFLILIIYAASTI